MRHVLGDAGIVDQGIETAPWRGRRDDLLAVLVTRDVALHHDHFGAGAAAEIGGRFGFLGAGGIIDDDARAALGQDGRGRGSQTRRRTRDNRAQTIPRHPHFLCDFWPNSVPAIYHIAPENACKSAKLRPPELLIPPRPELHVAIAGRDADIGACHDGGFSPSSGARKVRIRSFRPNLPGGMRAVEQTGNAVVESENIVAETAERIFSDLADAQTINRDMKGEWKAPLWQALAENGLTLSWVPEDCGGSGASLAEGFGVVSAAGRFGIAVPLAETMLAGWLLAQAKIASPEGAMTVAPASPKDRIALNADGTLSGRARGVPFAKDAKHIAVLAQGASGVSIALVDASTCRIEAGLNLASDGSDTVTFADVAPAAIKPAPKGFDQTALMLMGAVVRSLQIAGAWNRCSTSACATPTSASHSRRRSRNSRRCSTISRASPARPRLR